MSIRIVTDSTCDLPPELAEANQITVVPAYINIGDRSFLDGIELSRRDFYRNLASYSSPPTTAAPASGAFCATYETLAAAGATEIISIHIASSLSGMLNAARLGAEAARGVRVTLFDSGQLSMGVGLMAVVAAQASQAGQSVPQIMALLQETALRTHLFAALDTLEYLRRSGRVNWAQFGLGALLAIKPVIHVAGGTLEVERVRTRRRAWQRLLDLAAQYSPLSQLALLHTADAEGAERLRQETMAWHPAGIVPPLVEVTPAIGSHVGPGAVGFACISRGP